jgi:protein O-mannosyl-transferase
MSQQAPIQLAPVQVAPVQELTTPATPPWPRWLPYALLALAALTAYFNILSNDFVRYDDPPYITENTHVLAGLTWDSIRYAFSSVVVANYHPVTMLSHMLDVTFFGINPAAHHAISLALHGLNAILLYVVLNRFTAAPVRSLVVALLFATHPIHVESVAWASQRKDLLSFAFAMLTLLAYKHWLDHRTAARYTLIPLAFALAFLSKPTVITLPLALLLLDFWPLNRANTPANPQEKSFPLALKAYLHALPRLLWEKIPLLAISIAGSLLVYHVQSSAMSMVANAPVPMPARLANALFAYVRYLGKLAFPRDLALVYPHPIWWPASYIIASALALIAISALLFYLANRFDKRYLPVGWLWFLGVMVPMIGIVQVGTQSMADRYAYIPFIGLYILLVWGIADAFQTLKLHPSRRIVIYAVTGLTLLLIAMTRIQTNTWKSAESVMAHAIKTTGDNSVAQFALANILNRQERFQEAVPHFKEALRLEPTYTDAHVNLGTAYLRLNQLDEAQASYEKALAMDPTMPEPRLNLALVLNKRGISQAINGNYPAARDLFTRALSYNPNLAEAKANLDRVNAYIKQSSPQ